VDSQMYATDYETYQEIMSDLLRPIEARSIAGEVLVRLYQSKLVYLENLRTKCFYEMNAAFGEGKFTSNDYALIVEAIRSTRANIKVAVLAAIEENIGRRHAV